MFFSALIVNVFLLASIVCIHSTRGHVIVKRIKIKEIATKLIEHPKIIIFYLFIAYYGLFHLMILIDY